jgi:Polyketide cyclase / dehydrase and lipid transport
VRATVANARFEESVDIRAPADLVHARLVDLHRHRDLHPLIERIDDLPSDPLRPAARRYRVTDRLRLGPFHFRIHYVAEIEAISSSEIRGTAWQTPGVEVRTHFRVTAAPFGARVREKAVLKAPWPLIGYAARQAKSAHRETLAKLKIQLEQSQVTPVAGTT